MTARERFNAIFEYKRADRLPIIVLEPHEGFCLDRWREQGLPQDTSPEEYLGMDSEHKLPISFGPYPDFGSKIISEDNRYIVEKDGWNATVRRDKSALHMYYGYIDHPIKSKADWEEYKERFQFDPARYWRGFEPMIKDAENSENPVTLSLFPYFMRLGFYGMGLENFLTSFYDAPDLIHEIFSHFNDMVIRLIAPVIQRIKPDAVSFNEDLAFKNGPHFSPAIYKEFWLPHQNKLIKALRKTGVKNICMYSSGDFRALLPLMLDNGIDTIWPLDQNSNMDPIALRKEYGKKLKMAGGISKETLMGGPRAIDRRLRQLMPLIAEGGFIPAPDDMIPPETPFSHFVYLIEKLRAIKL